MYVCKCGKPVEREQLKLNFARLELCKSLFEVSGWRDTEYYWYQNWLMHSWQIGYQGQPDETTYPAFDLGYLLRKVPQNSWIGYVDTSGKRGYVLAKTYAWNTSGSDIEKVAECSADTLEDAACLLALELFDKDILRKE